MATTSSELSVLVEPLQSQVPVDAAVTHIAGMQDASILETTMQDHIAARYSIFAIDPIDEVSWNSNELSFDALIEHLKRSITTSGLFRASGVGLPFVGGWVGYLSYEAGQAIAGIRAPASCNDFPFAYFRLYDTVAIFDYWKGSWIGVAVNWPKGSMSRRISARARLDELNRLFDGIESASQGSVDRASARGIWKSAAPHNRFSKYDRSSISNSTELPRFATCDWPRDQYLQVVEDVLDRIAAGDVYQVNLSQRFSAPTNVNSADLYMRLRECNPSSHAAFFRVGDCAILSSSPELFIDLRGSRVRTRPIKGTRPRGEDTVSDRMNRLELDSSEKDRAELSMIVDLMRNDLGRVCEPGSVCVPDSGSIEILPTVFHRVATVEGQLQSGHDWSDLVRAAFPGGSITGAPKISAMRIIDELEPVPRGVYCGSIGYIGLDGSMSMNIAIRTMTHRGSTVHIHAGSGIVADSDPLAEYAEIMAKARAMFEAVGCHPSESSPLIRAGAVT